MLTSYPSTRTGKYVGSPSYQSIKGIVHSRVCEHADGIEFGMPAFTVDGASNDEGCTPDSTTGLIVGIAIRDHGQGMTYNQLMVPDSDVDGRYEQRAIVSILDKDAVVLSLSTSGNYRDIVYYDTADDLFKVVAATSVVDTQIAVGYLMETIAAAGAADVWIDTSLAIGAIAIRGANIADAPADGEVMVYTAANGTYAGAAN